MQERWSEIEAKAIETKKKAAGAAIALYEEPDVLVKVIRDLFNEDFSNLIVSGDEAWTTINDYVNSVAPDLVPRLTKYEPAGGDGPDVFAVHRIDEQLAKAMDRKVWLPSGGTLVIDRTEAMTVVDVNTGKFTGSGGNLEQTVTRNNLEAAEEIVRQLRLRDIGGIIVIDFIDMVLESNRDLVLRRLTEALARDRTRHQVSEVTSLGLVQLTRKRLGTGPDRGVLHAVLALRGRGILLHADPVDSAPAAGRKSDPGAAASAARRAAGPRTSPVAKVPPHQRRAPDVQGDGGRQRQARRRRRDRRGHQRMRTKSRRGSRRGRHRHHRAGRRRLRRRETEDDDVDDVRRRGRRLGDDADDDDDDDSDEIDLDEDDEDDDDDDDIEVIDRDDDDEDDDDDDDSTTTTRTRRRRDDEDDDERGSPRRDRRRPTSAPSRRRPTGRSTRPDD